MSDGGGSGQHDPAARGRVIVVGSANVDLTVTVAALPAPGQTVIARALTRRCGGKGANQAAAAGRLEAAVELIAAVGDDDDSAAVRAAAAEAGVGTERLRVSAGSPTGLAVITVDDAGENTIVVAQGANADLAPSHLGDPLADLGPGDVVVVSLEIPAETAAAALRLGRVAGATTMLNPSPYSPVVADLLPSCDVVIVNEGEAADLGAAVADRAALGVIVTLGGAGARVRPAGADDWHAVPAPRVEVVDTTGCGDAFAGAVAAGLADGVGLVDAVDVAVSYAALAATAPGAQSSYADRTAFEGFRARWATRPG